MNFSFKTRKDNIEKLKNKRFDLIIIGGGITGAGLALQASAAGMRVGLIEMQDFGAGTSSRSTRLVHGGIRYLKNFDVEVVSETVQERAVIQHIAPHVTKPDPMLMPIYDEPGTTFSMFSVKIAMDLYDRLAGINENKYLKKYANYTLDKEQVLNLEPQLESENLAGGGIYLDYLNNDSRLVIENIKKAEELGGVMVSRIKAVEVLHNRFNHANALKVQDVETGEEFEIKSKLFINTTGPWSDIVKSYDSENDNKKQMRPTKGVHLVVDQAKLNVPKPTYFGSGTNDGRMIFTIPRDGKTYFGTTDTDYDGDLEHPIVEQSDVDYLLSIINKKYPTAHLTIDDVESSWAGIRPLVVEVPDEDEEEPEVDVVSGASDSGMNKLSASAVSRGSSLKRASDGFITLAGGKLTDYRKMANGAMDMIIDILNKQFAKDFEPVDSAEIKVSGGDFDSNNAEDEIEGFIKKGIDFGLDEHGATNMANIFGSNMLNILEEYKDVRAYEGLSLADTLSILYSIDHEMTMDPEDFLFRRTNILLFEHDRISEMKDGLLNLMSERLGWDDTEKDRYKKQIDELSSEASLEYLKK